MTQELSVILGILFLTGVLVFFISENRRDSRGYYNKVGGYQIILPNKNWSIFISGVIKRFTNGDPFSEVIFKYKEKPYSFRVTFRTVGKIVRRKHNSFEEEVIELLKEWRTDPRNFEGTFDTYDFFSLPFRGKDIVDINRDSFKKIEYGGVKGIELSHDLDLKFNESALERIKVSSEKIEQIRTFTEKIRELLIFFEFKQHLFCFLAQTDLTSKIHPQMNQLVYELVKNFKPLP